MKRIVLASGNPGKIRELTELLRPIGAEVVPQSLWQLEECEETGLTFVENAILKARNAARHTGLPALADDSGIEVDFLRGEPGIYSARYSGPEGDDRKNNEKLLAAMQGVPPEARSARFRCVMVFLEHAQDPSPIITEGSWEGRIAAAEAGARGFGYDPLFYLPDRGCTSAELPDIEKNRLSHRGQAVRAMVERLARRLEQA
jgi:XTP/dITP diphosphohydrolase